MIPMNTYRCIVCDDILTVPRDSDTPACCLPMEKIAFTCSTCMGSGCAICNRTGKIELGKTIASAKPSSLAVDMAVVMTGPVDLDNIERGDRLAAERYTSHGSGHVVVLPKQTTRQRYAGID